MNFIEGRSLSVKCSNNTKSIINYIFKNDIRFVELKKCGVILNPSWFFKFCVNYTIKNLKITNDVRDYAYPSHYADYLDETIKSNIKTNII